MAYTVRLNAPNAFTKRDTILNYLSERLAKEGKFKATLTPITLFGKGGATYAAIRVKPVRLVKARPYCGGHFGPCPVSDKPKPRATYLEYEDWIKFHNVVNRCLNRFRSDADVWSTPMEGGVSKMWIRKGMKARVRYDAEEIFDYRGHHIGKWNEGSSDQFEAT